MQCLDHAGVAKPSEMQNPTREHAGHLGTRFGDRNVLLFLDGEPATENAVECVLGPDGWILHFDVEEYGGTDGRPPATRRVLCEDCMAEGLEPGPNGEHMAVKLSRGHVEAQDV